MLLRLFLLLTIIPIVELVILFRIAEWLRWGPTIAIILVTGAIGALLARHEGLKVLSRIRSDLAGGVTPTTAVVDGALILAAGIVLVTPGALTDLVGLALLVPPLRAWVRRRLIEAFRKRMVVMHVGDGAPFDNRDPFIDVRATSTDAEKDADELDPSRDSRRLDSDSQP